MTMFDSIIAEADEQFNLKGKAGTLLSALLALMTDGTRGGVGALARMIRLMKRGLPTGFTVDGPKGPKYVAKTGAVLLAKKTGNPLMPFVVETEKFWTIKSWDRLHIPKPFTRARVFIAEPIYVAPDAPDAEIENKRLELQMKLDAAVKLGKQWRDAALSTKGEKTNDDV